MLIVGSSNRVPQGFRRGLLENRVDRLLLLLLWHSRLHLCLRVRMNVQRTFVL